MNRNPWSHEAAPLRGGRGKKTHTNRCSLEALEARALLSVTGGLDGLFAVPNLDHLDSVALGTVANQTPHGYTPAQILHAYGFDQISLAGGAAADGSGQTIAIVDAYDDPNIAADLHTFDQAFGIADPPQFIKLNQSGGMAMPQTDASWAQEIALDVEWAHALAPMAKIVLVEANSSSITDLLAAVDTARSYPGVSVVSMSWGTPEFAAETADDQHFTTPAGHVGVSFVTSAGDGGAGTLWPAVSPNVVTVGGSSLSLADGEYDNETAWSGSGGGASLYESEPSFQQSVQTSEARTSPDVAYNADPSQGYAVYDSVTLGAQTGWMQIGGTSAGAAQWSALLALADQGRTLTGLASLTDASSAIYNLPSADFHDIASGGNGNAAGTGYDLISGRGTPIANQVVADLIAVPNVAGGSAMPVVTDPPAAINAPPPSIGPGPAPAVPPSVLHDRPARIDDIVTDPGHGDVAEISESPRAESVRVDANLGLGAINALANGYSTLAPSAILPVSFAPSMPLATSQPMAGSLPSLPLTVLSPLARRTAVGHEPATTLPDTTSEPAVEPATRLPAPTVERAPLSADHSAPIAFWLDEPADEIVWAGSAELMARRAALELCLAAAAGNESVEEELVEMPVFGQPRWEIELASLAIGLALCGYWAQEPSEPRRSTALCPGGHPRKAARR